MVVLHYTAMESCDAARDRLCDPGAEVSAHYLISETGDVLHLVKEDMRAWHAGSGQWGDVTDVNSRSIGIELANTGSHPFSAPQMDNLETLLADLLDRHGISPARVIGHSDMAPGRKSDPGPRFDWRRLARQGLSIWPQMHTTSESFSTLAKRFGYAQDLDEDLCLIAFRQRFRPWATGPLQAADTQLMADLAHRFPFDPSPSST